jgi:hypothetical protein
MKRTGPRNFFLLVLVRRIAQDFPAFFRFTEADAYSILCAYGLHTLEADHLQNNRPNELKGRGEAWGGKPSQLDGRAFRARNAKPSRRLRS